MFTLLKKEINSFLSSLIGYIVIIVFLVTTGLFLWVFSGNFNILDGGYANLDSFFIIAPWVFMFLVPAVTMRSFADEKKSGTIELLFTRPINDIQIILAKYTAGLVLVLFSILPTFVYCFSVYALGFPQGNLDIGGIWGSYIGLFFLAAGFVAIGVFASSITENQVIAFILAVFLSFFCYIGFDSISSLDMFGSVNSILLQIGINQHYVSMSRGVIDTRDVIYFLSLTIVFILLTKTVLESRKWNTN